MIRSKYIDKLYILLAVVSIAALLIVMTDFKYTNAEEIECNNAYSYAGDSIIVEIDKEIIDVESLIEESKFENYDVKNIYEIYNVDNTYMMKVEMNYDNRSFIMSDIENINDNLGIQATPNYIGEFGYSMNDPSFNLQWGLNDSSGIDVETAWEFERGSNSVCVGVIDTGIFPHEDLVDNLVQGFSFVGENNNTDDYYGHGTHVAGIIGAVGDNNIGISGVAPNIEIMPLKISDTNNWETANVIAAINYAQSLWGGSRQVDILNFSGWNFPKSDSLQSAIENYPGLFVTIAGNGNSNIDSNPNYPGSFNIDNLITVGSIDQNGDKSSFSNYGLSVDIYAPGSEIYSTLPNNNYGYMSGTSMAAPHVAGAAALLLSMPHPFQKLARNRKQLHVCLEALSHKRLMESAQIYCFTQFPRSLCKEYHKT